MNRSYTPDMHRPLLHDIDAPQNVVQRSPLSRMSKLPSVLDDDEQPALIQESNRMNTNRLGTPLRLAQSVEGQDSYSRESTSHRPRNRRFNLVASLLSVFGILEDVSSRLEKIGAYDADSKLGEGRRVEYEDFTTIDWNHDASKERSRVLEMRKLVGNYALLNRLYDASQGWLVIIMTGIVTGWLCGFTDIASEWLADVREGYCSAGFYLNKTFCCWFENNDSCHDWISWSQAMGSTSESPIGWMIEGTFYTLWAVLFALSSAILVNSFAPYAAGSGIPEVKTILGGFVIRKFLGMWTLIVKCLGLVLSVGSGLALGKEGPLVHVACCVGNVFLRIFPKYSKNEAKKREILSAACAAGVSVAFGAPIGGVLFSLEEVSYYFPYKTMWRSFFMAMIAALSLQLLNPFRTGRLVLFQVDFKRDWNAFELPVFALLGILGGLYGAFFIRVNVQLASMRKNGWLKSWPISEVVSVALISAIINFPFRFLRVSMAELVSNLFRECAEVDWDFHGLCKNDQFTSVVTSLFFDAAIKIIFAILTFGLRVPAGIFIPSMTIGACVGRAFGMIMQSLHYTYPNSWVFASCNGDTACVTPGTYAVVGAAASLAGVTRMTVSLAVIMFELTGAVSYVLPIMMTVMVAKWVGDSLGREGIYDALIRLNGYPFLDSKEEYETRTKEFITAASVMTKVEEMELIASTGTTIGALEELIETTKFKGFPIVTESSLQTIGFIGRAELRYLLRRVKRDGSGSATTPCIFDDMSSMMTPTEDVLDLRPWIDETPMMVHPRFPMEMVMELFKKMGLRYVLVTRNGHLRGILTKKDLLRHLSMNGGGETLMNATQRVTG